MNTAQNGKGDKSRISKFSTYQSNHDKIKWPSTRADTQDARNSSTDQDIASNTKKQNDKDSATMTT